MISGAPSAATPFAVSDVLSANRLGMSQMIAKTMSTVAETMLKVRLPAPTRAAVGLAMGAAPEIGDFVARGVGDGHDQAAFRVAARSMY